MAKVSKKTAAKKGKPARRIRRATRPHWQMALEPLIVEQVIGPIVGGILVTSGASSIADLRAKFSDATSCAISAPTFRRWLSHLPQITALFTNDRPTRFLPGTPNSQPTIPHQDGSLPPVPVTATGDDPDFVEGIHPVIRDLPTDIPAEQPWSLQSLGLAVQVGTD